MIKIKVWSIQEILIRLILLCLCFSIVALLICVLVNQNFDNIEKKILDDTLLVRHKNNNDSKNNPKDLLKSELSILNNIDIDDDAEEREQIQNVEHEEENHVFSTPGLYAQKLSNGQYKVGSVYINSYLEQQIDLEELEKPLEITVSRPCSVLIYHTHTSESYTLDNQKHSDYYRTEDNQYNVVAVGKKLAENLTNLGFFVTQDTTQHDYPSYNGAYKASLATVEKHLKERNYDIILDIHRDALSGNANFRPTAEINGETSAKLMIVVGTNDAGLEHDNWMKNFKFALALQEKGNEMYPGLFRDMHLSTSRYNQHTSDKTLIIEVGATGNTMEETEIAMKYLANILNCLVNSEH